MKALLSLLSTAFIFATLFGFVLVSSPGQAYPPGMNGKSQDYDFGVISSIQYDQAGNPAWIVSGMWKGNRFSNVTTANSSDIFSANVNMIMLNGSVKHNHTITNFNLTDIAEENGIKVFYGTATASIREGPVTDVPTTVRVMGDSVISLWLGPTTINEHYGNTPIYRLVMEEKEQHTELINNNSRS